MKHGRTTMNLQANIKAQSRNASPPRTKKFKSEPSVSKVMLMLFWDYDGPILKYYQDHGQMVNSAWYCAMLEEEKSPTCSEHRQMLTTGIVLYHNNTQSHTAAATIEMI
jgi:hypothetical protein